MNLRRRWAEADFFLLYAMLAALLLLAPIRIGDLAGYDDALYAHIAKGIVVSGDWLNIRSNGDAALEHPPLLVWTEAALFEIFGFSDSAARLPSAFAGFGTILLVYWLGRKLTGDRFRAFLAMFVMATSIYFLKYASRAMTDVPCTFLFIAAVCAWTRIEEDRRWYLAAGALTALALLSRGMIGFGLPVIFAIDLMARRKRPPLGYAIGALAIALLPLSAWYVHVIWANGSRFFGVHATWLRNEVYGPLSPPWRRYTGGPEYVWMLAKSYWPWLPAMAAGTAFVIRKRDRKLLLLVIWAAVVFALCAMAKSRVLRYMLPAYPAFSILAAVGMARYVSLRYLKLGIQIVTPVLAVAVIALALFPPVIWHAADVRPLAMLVTAVTPPEERIAFYDEGNPRFDVTNQLQWYGGRNLLILLTLDDLRREIATPRASTMLIDSTSYDTFIAGRVANRVLAKRGNLVCFQWNRAEPASKIQIPTI